ncbi:hypothetical protein V1512DRAFT_282677, partial [Lipomyces arxii]|uniref:uncharacterized protein n=1 Tax=Lipomyces arxii TaxID=56418 RepID=UPI0034CD75B9
TRRLQLAFQLKNLVLAQIWDIDRNDQIGILGSRKFERHVFKHYCVQKRPESPTKYDKLISLAAHTDLDEALNQVKIDGLVAVEVSILNDRSSTVAWYKALTAQYCGQQHLAGLTMTSLKSAFNFLLQRDIKIESVVDTSFEQANICRESANTAATRVHAVCAAWTAVLIVNGEISSYVLIGRKC